MICGLDSILGKLVFNIIFFLFYLCICGSSWGGRYLGRKGNYYGPYLGRHGSYDGPYLGRHGSYYGPYFGRHGNFDGPI